MGVKLPPPPQPDNLKNTNCLILEEGMKGAQRGCKQGSESEILQEEEEEEEEE